MRNVDREPRRTTHYNETEVRLSTKMEFPLGKRANKEVELSKSLKEDLRTWVHSLETYFGENYIPEQERLQVVYSSLEGKTCQWIKNLWKKNLPTIWKEFKCMLDQETKTTRVGDHRSQSPYVGLQQEGLVHEYRMRFEALCLNTISLLGRYLEDIFLQGLKPNLRTAVRKLQPNGLIHMMDLAQWLEESNNLMVSKSMSSIGLEPKGYQSTQVELMSLVLIKNKKEAFKDAQKPVKEARRTLTPEKRVVMVRIEQRQRAKNLWRYDGA